MVDRARVSRAWRIEVKYQDMGGTEMTAERCSPSRGDPQRRSLSVHPTSGEEGGPSEGTDRRWQALAVCLVAAFMTLLDVSIVNVALPSIRSGLDASSDGLQWILSGYAVAFGLALVPAGRLGDARSRRAVFMTGLALFTLSSAVTGAAGAYGGYMVQLGKARGLRVVADASPEDEPLVRRLGADVIVARGEGLALRIRQAVPDGVDGLADGAVVGAPVLPAVRDGGVVVSVRSSGADSERGITVHDVMVSAYAREWDKLDELRRLTETGAVTLRVARTYPPERAADAHRALEAGGSASAVKPSDHQNAWS